MQVGRQVPVFGSPLVQVATSAFEVKMIGSSAVPRATMRASRVTASAPPRFVVLAITVPASMVRVAPGRT